QKLPRIADHDALVSHLNVRTGDTIVDADGNLNALAIGVRLRPAGCRADSCAITYTGSNLQMDSLNVTFHLRPDATWSDGTPLTADDSVYGYQVALADKASPLNYLAARTKTYIARDDITLQWTGVPGYFDPTYFTDFFPPAPKHVWNQFTASDL